MVFVCNYVEWSLHEPFPDVYNFEEIADLKNFIKLINLIKIYTYF